MKPVLLIILYIDLMILCSCIDNRVEVAKMPPAIIDHEAIRQMEKK